MSDGEDSNSKPRKNYLRFTPCPISYYQGRMWDKLVYREKGDVFTTYRGYSWKKYNYYKMNEYNLFDVYNNKMYLGKARLVDSRVICPHEYMSPEDIRLDTFSNLDDPVKFWNELMEFFYGDKDVVLIRLVFVWEEVNKDEKEGE